jgi:hypothetical protein
MGEKVSQLTKPKFHGLRPSPTGGAGKLLFGVAQFVRTLENNYARPGGHRVKGAPVWLSHTFDDRFRFAAEKLWDTVWKINRVAELTHLARCNIRDLQPPSVPVEELGRHMVALLDVPIYLETLIVYLRVVADCVANLTPYLYGQKGKNLPKDSFREQREWLVSKKPGFDSAYVAILKTNTNWFDVLAGNPPDYIGLRDAIVHYRGGIQIMYQPPTGGAPAKLMPMLFSDYKTLTRDLFTLLQKVMKDMCVFLDRYVEHLNAIANGQTQSSLLNLGDPLASVLFQYEGELPSAWLYPFIGETT